MKKYNGAQIVVQTLINNGVKYVFGIPGAKIDRVFNEIKNNPQLELIVTYHEQNAAFMAQAIGRITGKPGVCIATSGPGISNLTTGLATANSESDAVLAIGGNVVRSELHKHSHQSMDNASLMRRVTKFAGEVVDVDNVGEIMQKAYREAAKSPQGATFVSFPMDVLNDTTDFEPIKLKTKPAVGIISPQSVIEIISQINKAKLPVLLVGMRGSDIQVAYQIRELVKNINIPIAVTYQASGILSRDQLPLFYGRIGLFKNQPGDKLLDKSDLVITIGYDPIEYEPNRWNQSNDKKVINLDSIECDVDNYFNPDFEYICDLEKSLALLNKYSDKIKKIDIENPTLVEIRNDITNSFEKFTFLDDYIHPIQFIKKLQSLVDDEMTVCVDVGSHYIWMARYYRTYRPRSLLFSNGMQTLGVALPWAIATALIRPNHKVISISGDGGFTFSAAELKNAVKYKMNIIHFVWNSNSYDMVAFQEMLKYGQTSGVELENLDYVKFAESFGAVGLKVNNIHDFDEVMKKAFSYKDIPVVVEIPIDYKDNIELAKKIKDGELI